MLPKHNLNHVSHYKHKPCIIEPKVCIGSAKICLGTTRHILDRQKDNQGYKKENTFVVFALTTMGTYNVGGLQPPLQEPSKENWNVKTKMKGSFKKGKISWHWNIPQHIDGLKL
jgi:hypothetical protein